MLCVPRIFIFMYNPLCYEAVTLSILTPVCLSSTVYLPSSPSHALLVFISVYIRMQ